MQRAKRPEPLCTLVDPAETQDNGGRVAKRAVSELSFAAVLDRGLFTVLSSPRIIEQPVSVLRHLLSGWLDLRRASDSLLRKLAQLPTVAK